MFGFAINIMSRPKFMTAVVIGMLITVISICISNVNAAVSTKPTAGWKTVASDDYSFKYPTSWELKQKENRFDFDATLEHDGAVITFDHGPEYHYLYNRTDKMANMLTLQYKNFREFESGSDKYVINNKTASYVIGTYTESNQFGFEKDFAIMSIAISLKNNDTVVGQFFAEKNEFDKLLSGNVEQIFESIKPTVNDLHTDREIPKFE